jgi:hypothetical protein
MDSRLSERLKKWHERIESLTETEATYLRLEASEKTLFSQLFLEAEGTSVAEREAKAYSSPEWTDFKRGLAEAKSAYNSEKRKLELSVKAYESEYLTYKLESEAVRRHP